ncbi:MAG TPA: hypothetical protein VFM54_18145 [Micromonosporaceae bacterium]|nr:hypothetical protein [Micromonosporaceae bacterium]
MLKAVEDSDDGDRDGGALVLRAYESMGRCVQATFGPHEIKTLRIPRDADRPVRETNLLEWVERPDAPAEVG